MSAKKLCTFCLLIFVLVMTQYFSSCSSQIDEIACVQETEEKIEEPVTDEVISNTDTGVRGYNPNTDSWTLMFYFGGDNSLDTMLTENVRQLVQGYCGGMKAILLIDRASGAVATEPFGEAFSTTRMYKVTREGLVRLYGGTLFPELAEENGDCELDTADAGILKNFIHYCKSEYPAEHYGLIIGSHGGGVRTGNQNARGVVQDSSSDNDWIFTAELTDVLTADESVDVLGLDACCMGNLEVAYQLCGIKDFSTDYFVASPAEEWSNGWNYISLEALFSGLSPEPAEFAQALVNNYKDYIENYSTNTMQTLTCLKSSFIPAVKTALDNLSQELTDYKRETELLRGSQRLKKENVLFYFNSVNTTAWLKYPYFDIYSLAKRISADQNFSQEARNAAQELTAAIDDAVISSYAGSGYPLAEEDRTGLAIFFPDGKGRCGFLGKTYWDYQYWYNPSRLADTQYDKCYGGLAFCADGAIPENGVVENWFELLDYWFDDSDNVNGYTP